MYAIVEQDLNGSRKFGVEPLVLRRSGEVVRKLVASGDLFGLRQEDEGGLAGILFGNVLRELAADNVCERTV